MTYPNDLKPVKFRVLEAVQTILEGIAQPDYKFTMQRVTFLDSGQAFQGDITPAIAIVSVSDDFSQTFSCEVDERVMILDLYGVLRVVPGGELWKEHLHWLLADMKRALAADIKLGSTAVFSEVGPEDTYESQDSQLVLARLSLSITYRHSTLDPTV